MSSNNKHFKYIDILRIFSCIMIFLYHLNMLKGGFLAVSIFFVISGYLSTIKLFKKEKISFKEFYLNKLFRLYLPMLIVVFVSIGVIKLFLDVNWFNLKPEVTSIMLGYNNFWQIMSNMDYFRSGLESPFIHLWYMAILMQFDLVFPFIFLLLKKIGDKINRIIPITITLVISLLGGAYFYYSGINNDILFTYYNTFTRMFALFFGITLGFIYHYYGNLVSSKIKNPILKKCIFYTYLVILLLLFIFINPSSKYIYLGMIIITLLSVRITDYATLICDNWANTNKFDKIIGYASSISYEIYLIEYVVIYLFEYIDLNKYLELFLIIIITILLSMLLHFITTNKDKKYKNIRYILGFMFSGILIYGIYEYVVSVDYTKDINKLKNQLEQNEKLVKDNKDNYMVKLKEEEDNWQKKLQTLEEDESKLDEIVTNLPVVGIGDSVLLGAVNNLYNRFPNGYFDGKVSRTAWGINDILLTLKNNNVLGNPIIFNLGTNGDCSLECKEEILRTCEDRDIFWINTVNLTDVNVRLNNLASSHSNLHIIDWYSISRGHNEYFTYDGIHLTNEGRKVYTDTIYNAIYNIYKEKYIEKKNNMINKHDEEIKSKISFYGNDLLLNAFNNIKTNFTNANYITNKDFNYNSLKKEIKKEIKDNTLNHNVVFLFDNSVNISKKEYNNLIKLCDGHNIYIISTDKKLSNIKFDYENVRYINVYSEIKDLNYLTPDNIHLNKEGNEYLGNLLNEVINNNK